MHSLLNFYLHNVPNVAHGYIDVSVNIFCHKLALESRDRGKGARTRQFVADMTIIEIGGLKLFRQIDIE